jgi:hypothetical protein
MHPSLGIGNPLFTSVKLAVFSNSHLVISVSPRFPDDTEMKDVVGSDDGKEWGKKVDENLCEYIPTTGCRTIVNDKYFNNPPCPPPELRSPGKLYLQVSNT